MIPWPNNLPFPTQEYNVTSTGRLIVTPFEIGFRQRRRYANKEDLIRVSWVMTQLQYDIFCHFVREILFNGANPFNTSIIGLDGIEDAEVILKDGAYAAAYAPGNYQKVTADLVRVDPTVMDANTYDLMVSDVLGSPDNFLFLSDALFVYIEEVFGDSSANETTNTFMKQFNV